VGALDDFLRYYGALTPAEQHELEAQAIAATADRA
jgi:hypothetical protein